MSKERKMQWPKWSGAEVSSSFDKVNGRMDSLETNFQDFRTEEKQVFQETGESVRNIMRTAFEMQTTLDQLVESGFLVRKQETRKPSHHSDLPKRIRPLELGYAVGPVFTGVDLRLWLDWMENHFLLSAYTDLQKLKFCQCFIEDEAKSWLQETQGWFHFKSWKSLKEGLLLRFGKCEDPERIEICLENEQRLKNWSQKVKDRVLLAQNSESLKKDIESKKETELQKATESQSRQEKERFDIRNTKSFGKVEKIQEKTELRSLQEKDNQITEVATQEEEELSKTKGMHVSSALAVAELSPKLIGVKTRVVAHQLFGKMLLRGRSEKHKKMQRKLLKSWKFRFKSKKIAKLHLRGGKFLLNTTYKLQKIWQKRMKRKLRKYPRSWKFKFIDVSKRRVYNDVGLAVGFCTVKHTWSSKFKIEVIWVAVKSSDDAIASLQTQQLWLLQLLIADQFHYQWKKQLFSKDWYFKYKQETWKSEKAWFKAPYIQTQVGTRQRNAGEPNTLIVVSTKARRSNIVQGELLTLRLLLKNQEHSKKSRTSYKIVMR